MIAILYVRSTAGQASIDRQIACGEAALRAHGWHSHILVRDTTKGRHLEDLLTSLALSDITTIYAESLDRLSRYQDELEIIRERLTDRGIALLTFGRHTA